MADRSILDNRFVLSGVLNSLSLVLVQRKKAVSCADDTGLLGNHHADLGNKLSLHQLPVRVWLSSHLSLRLRLPPHCLHCRLHGGHFEPYLFQDDPQDHPFRQLRLLLLRAHSRALRHQRPRVRSQARLDSVYVVIDVVRCRSDVLRFKVPRACEQVRPIRQLIL